MAFIRLGSVNNTSRTILGGPAYARSNSYVGDDVFLMISDGMKFIPMSTFEGCTKVHHHYVNAGDSYIVRTTSTSEIVIPNSSYTFIPMKKDYRDIAIIAYAKLGREFTTTTSIMGINRLILYRGNDAVANMEDGINLIKATTGNSTSALGSYMGTPIIIYKLSLSSISSSGVREPEYFSLKIQKVTNTGTSYLCCYQWGMWILEYSESSYPST